jgi:hypothetical protein
MKFDLWWCRSDDFYVMEFAEQRGLDDKAGTEDGDAAGRSRVELLDKRIKDVDDGHWRDGGELADAVVRSDRWDSSELGSGGVEAADKAGEIFGETVAIIGLHVGKYAGGLGVGDDDVESAALRVNLVGFG